MGRRPDRRHESLHEGRAAVRHPDRAIDDHGPAVGVIHLPALGETIAAAGDSAAPSTARPAVSGHDTLDGAYATTSGLVLALSGTAAGTRQRRRLSNVGRRLRLRPGRHRPRRGDDRSPRQPMGHRPMAVIIPEAGGRFSNFDGVERPTRGTATAASPRTAYPRRPHRLFNA